MRSSAATALPTASSARASTSKTAGAARRDPAGAQDPRGDPGVYEQASTPPRGLLTHGAEQAQTFFGTHGQGVEGLRDLGWRQLSRDSSVDAATCRQWTFCRVRPAPATKARPMLEIVHDLAPGASSASPPRPTKRGAVRAEHPRPRRRRLQHHRRRHHLPRRVAVPGRTGRPGGQHGHGRRRPLLLVGRQRGQPERPHLGHLGGRLQLPMATPGRAARRGGDGPRLRRWRPTRSSSRPAAAISRLSIWAEHYDLSTGSASTDFDLYVLNGALTTVFDASTDVQDGAGGDDFPVEIMGGGIFAGERIVVAQFTAGTTAASRCST